MLDLSLCIGSILVGSIAGITLSNNAFELPLKKIKECSEIYDYQIKNISSNPIIPKAVKNKWRSDIDKDYDKLFFKSDYSQSSPYKFGTFVIFLFLLAIGSTLIAILSADGQSELSFIQNLCIMFSFGCISLNVVIISFINIFTFISMANFISGIKSKTIP